MIPTHFKCLLLFFLYPCISALLYPCQNVPVEARQQCDEGGPCHYPTFCNGISSHCPSTVQVADGNECLDGQGVCQKGVCIRSVCKELEECVCPTIKHECVICCQSAGVCQPAFVVGLIGKDNDIYSRPDETLCDQGRGHCVHSVCLSSNSVRRPDKRSRSGDAGYGAARSSSSNGDTTDEPISLREMRDDIRTNSVLTIIALTLAIVCFIAVLIVIVFLLSTGLWLWYTPSEERIRDRPRP